MTTKTYALNVTLTDTGKLSKKQNHARYEYNDDATGLHVIAWIPVANPAVKTAKATKATKTGTAATQPAVDFDAITAKITASVLAALEKKLA